jgi:hypothetical protein
MLPAFQCFVLRRLAPVLATLLLVAACGSSATTAVPPGSAGDSAPAGPAGTAPPPSAVGSPTGDSVTKTIGPAGGSLSSADGGITVSIPSGALASDTAVGIVPIENTTPGGLGAAYRLSPDGQTFSQPVKVSFPYTDADLKGTSLEALGIAFQDAQGLWEWQETVAVDTTAKQISVMTTHFTDWTKVPGMQLRPGAATVKVKGSLSLVADSCIQPMIGGKTVVGACVDAADDDLAQLVGVKPATWAVNGQTGGSTAAGTVTGNSASGVFTAPAKKPAGAGGKSTVAVSVEARVRGGKTLLVANVTIVDGGYKVTGSYSENNSQMVCAGAISALVTDTVEFTLAPTDSGSFTVTNIKNSKTEFKPPTLPVAGLLTVAAKTPPDVLLATGGTVDVSDSLQLVTVNLSGSSTLGICTLSDKSGSITGTGGTSDSSARVEFYMDRFVGGTQVGIDDSKGYADPSSPWAWVVTEL